MAIRNQFTKLHRCDAGAYPVLVEENPIVIPREADLMFGLLVSRWRELEGTERR